MNLINAPIQLFLSVFLIFALSRVVLRHKEGNLTLGEFLFWFALFALAMIGVIEPNFTNYLARVLGIGRGADVVVYSSIVLLFYLIFRTNIALEETRHEITKLVRLIALKDQQKNNKSTQKIKS